jgi:hypothetical protein
MSDSIKAALFSAFVLPGTGHFILKSKTKAYILFTLVFVSLAIVINETMQHAQIMVQKIEHEGVSIDIDLIKELATQPTNNSLLMTASSLMFIACWGFSVIDSFRIGAKQTYTSTNKI